MSAGTFSKPKAEDRPVDPASPPKPIPPLRNGDHLRADEFERRYDAMPYLKKAELIEGEVYIPSPDFYLPEGYPPDMGSPVSYQMHSKPHSRLMGWLVVYSGYTAGTGTADNGSIRLDTGNMPQPDGCLVIEPEYGGQVQISEDDFLVGAPDFVFEIAYSSVSIDLHKKFEMYRRHGAREYLVWCTEDEAFHWFINHDGQFEQLALGPDSLLRSEIFPGLWLDPAAMIVGNLPRVFEVVQQGLASPEHAAFVEQLRQRAAAQEPPH